MRSFQVQAPLLAIVWLMLTCASPARAAGEDLMSAANGDHLWFVIPSAKNGGKEAQYDLCHHGLDAGGPYFKAQCKLTEIPIAMASRGNRVWLVFPPKGKSADASREVFTIEVQQNKAFGGYFSVPAGRLDIAAPLPAAGRLASFIVTERGPVALIVPAKQAKASQQSEVAETTPSSLLQLVNDRWTTLEPPPDFDPTAPAILAPGAAAGAEFSILAPALGDPQRTLRQTRSHEGAWTASFLTLDFLKVHAIINMDRQVAAILAAASDRQIEVAYMRAGGVVPLAMLPPPEGQWSILGMRSGFRLVERATQGSVFIREIQPLSGAVSQPQAMTLQPITTGKFWQVSMLIAVSISVLLLVFLIKPVSKAPVTLAPGVTPLPITLRLGALLIDLMPAGIVAGLILRAPLLELLSAPTLTFDLERCVPYMLMAGLTVLHSTVGELYRNASLGKALVGGRVTTADGSNPRIGQILLRNGLKCLVLLVPPLAVFGLINPHLQGLPDMAAGTLIVRRAPEQSINTPDDR
jgi:uncharacterized RDD family membrane protein YckC